MPVAQMRDVCLEESGTDPNAMTVRGLREGCASADRALA